MRFSYNNFHGHHLLLQITAPPSLPASMQSCPKALPINTVVHPHQSHTLRYISKCNCAPAGHSPPPFNKCHLFIRTNKQTNKLKVWKLPECGQGLIIIDVCRRDGSNHGCFWVATKVFSEQPGQNWVAIWNKVWFFLLPSSYLLLNLGSIKCYNIQFLVDFIHLYTAAGFACLDDPFIVR